MDRMQLAGFEGRNHSGDAAGPAGPSTMLDGSMPRYDLVADGAASSVARRSILLMGMGLLAACTAAAAAAWHPSALERRVAHVRRRRLAAEDFHRVSARSWSAAAA